MSWVEGQISRRGTSYQHFRFGGCCRRVASFSATAESDGRHGAGWWHNNSVRAGGTMTDTQKAYAAIAILGIWGVLAGLEMTPMEQFIQVLRDALIGLGVFTATMSDPKK